jgi:catalase
MLRNERDGSWSEAQHMIDGGPSVLFDDVAVLASPATIEDLMKEALQGTSWWLRSSIASSSATRAPSRFSPRPISPTISMEALSSFLAKRACSLRVRARQASGLRREPALKLGKAFPPVSEQEARKSKALALPRHEMTGTTDFVECCHLLER